MTTVQQLGNQCHLHMTGSKARGKIVLHGLLYTYARQKIPSTLFEVCLLGGEGDRPKERKTENNVSMITLGFLRSSKEIYSLQ